MNEGLNALVILGTAFIFFVMIKSEFSIPMCGVMLSIYIYMIFFPPTEQL